GHRFYTHTDTEVIVHLYEEMGANCVTRLRGMFALALYDQRQQSLLLARDRLGKKPLHYALHHGRLLFASEIKSLLAVAPELAEVDREGLLQYFYFGYIPDPFTAFCLIRKLPPGHLMEYARMVAERFSTEHHELIVDPNIEDTLAYLATLLEEPFGDSSMLPTYHVCRMARQKVTVALSGDGGDELFAGYDRYLVALRRRRFDHIPPLAGSFYRNHIHPRLPAHVYGKDLAWNASLNGRDRYLDAVSFFPAR